MRATSLSLLLLLLCGAAPPPPAAPRRELDAVFAKMQAERFEEALRDLAQLESRFPKEALVPFYEAQCELNLGRRERSVSRLDRALALLHKALERNPALPGGTFLRTAIHLERAARFFDRGRYAEAVAGLRAVLADGDRGQRARARVLLPQALFRQAVEAYEKDDFDQAEEIIPLFEEAHTRFGILKDDLRLLPAGRRQFAVLWVRCKIDLAALHQTAQNFPIARKYLAEVLRLRPEDPLPHYEMGKFLGLMQEYDEALVEYRKALALSKDPTWLEPCLQMAYIHSKKGHDEKALELFRRYLGRYPDSWYGHYFLGEHLAGIGRLAGAAAEYRRCVEIDRKSFAAAYKLYKVLRRRRKVAEAELWRRLYDHLRALRNRAQPDERRRTAEERPAGDGR